MAQYNQLGMRELVFICLLISMYFIVSYQSQWTLIQIGTVFLILLIGFIINKYTLN